VGLQKAGPNPTRQSFLGALHNLQGWNAEGLLPNTADFTLANFGKPATTSCAYFVKLQGSAFVPLNNGKPYCGALDPLPSS
jgi:hypothetical protein